MSRGIVPRPLNTAQSWSSDINTVLKLDKAINGRMEQSRPLAATPDQSSSMRTRIASPDLDDAQARLGDPPMSPKRRNFKAKEKLSMPESIYLQGVEPVDLKETPRKNDKARSTPLRAHAQRDTLRGNEALVE